jgi:hypothetical protein
MTNSFASSSVNQLTHESTGLLHRLMEQMIARDPAATSECRLQLLGLLEKRLSQHFGEAQIQSLLACAARRAKVDLSTLKYDGRCPRAGPACPGDEQDEVASASMRLLAILVAMLVILIGEHATTRYVRQALHSIAAKHS